MSDEVGTCCFCFTDGPRPHSREHVCALAAQGELELDEHLDAAEPGDDPPDPPVRPFAARAFCWRWSVLSSLVLSPPSLAQVRLHS